MRYQLTKIFLNMKTRISLSIGMMVLFTSVIAEVIVVPDQQPAIQAGIDAASNGDTILVQPGTYFESINFNGKNVVVASTFILNADTSLISQTVIDAECNGSVVTINSGESDDARLIGFTLTNGCGTDINGSMDGGGIYCENSDPVLDHLRIVNNAASGMGGGVGGGICFRNSSAHVKNSVFINNSANRGGGIRVDNSNKLVIKKCLFKDNWALNAGAGIMFYECPGCLVTQSVFTGNQTIYGGAICTYESSPVIDRITSYLNRGLYGGTLQTENGSLPIMVNSVCWQNAMNAGEINEIEIDGYASGAVVAYCDVLGGEEYVIVSPQSTLYWMEENINVNPLFADTNNLDLSLQQGSPCIDEGTAEFIYNGEVIVSISDYSGSAPDMGAYEYGWVTNDDEYNLQGKDMQFFCEQVGNSIHMSLKTGHSQQVSVRIYDVQGKLMSNPINRILQTGTNKIEIETPAYNRGIYIVSLFTDSGVVSKKLFYR
jgi:hypothetical protein